MVHDQIASAVALARGMKATLDYGRLETSVQTGTLGLLLTTLIDLGTPKQTRDRADAGDKMMMGLLVQGQQAIEARDGTLSKPGSHGTF